MELLTERQDTLSVSFTFVVNETLNKCARQPVFPVSTLLFQACSGCAHVSGGQTERKRKLRYMNSMDNNMNSCV